MEYSTKTTASGSSTFLLCGEATVAVFVAPDHVEAAAFVAELLNAEVTMAWRPVDRNFPP